MVKQYSGNWNRIPNAPNQRAGGKGASITDPRYHRLRCIGSVMQYDIKGREIKAGDLLKVPHFTAARRRTRIYMYKLVCRADDRMTITKDGQYLYAVDVCDIYRKGSLNKAHKCPLSVVGDCEIIDGGTVDDDDLFWERKRAKPVSA